jgi:hypothetical protein
LSSCAPLLAGSQSEHGDDPQFPFAGEQDNATGATGVGAVGVGATGVGATGVGVGVGATGVGATGVGVGVGATGVGATGVGVPQADTSEMVTPSVLSEFGCKHGVDVFSPKPRVTLYAPPPQRVPVTVTPPDTVPVIEYILHIFFKFHLSKNHRVP